MQAARRALIFALVVALFLVTPPDVARGTWEAARAAAPDEAPDPEALAWAGIAVLAGGVVFLRAHNAHLEARARRPEGPEAAASARAAEKADAHAAEPST